MKPQLLSFAQAGAELGVSARMVRRFVTGGELRAVNVASKGASRCRLRVRRDDLDRFINRRTAATKKAAS